MAFKYAVYRINKERLLLPNTTLVYDVQYVPRDDSFRAAKKGLFKLQELVRVAPAARAEMYIRQAGPSSYRAVLREVRQKEIFQLIVDTDPKHMPLFFRAILQLQMNDFRYHYMFTTFDIETFDLEDFKYNSVNMTAFRLVDADAPWVTDVLGQMERFQPVGSAILHRSGVIQASALLPP
ncbi:Glutamate receptor, ionotropic kainate 1, partial [Gryllus bimaculatus]